MAFNFTATSSQYLSTASTPVSGSPMTFSALVNPAMTGGQVVMSVGATAQRNQMQIQSDGVFIVAVGSLANGQTTSQLTTANVWQHVAGVFSSQTSRRTYLNGAAGTENTTNIGSQNTATDILIGARRNTAIGNYFQGSIAEVGIWNVALTAAEIASLADGMTCDKVRPQSLVFYAPLVRSLQDVRGGLTITNNNTATVAVHPRVYA
jgi:hypothetical protein